MSLSLLASRALFLFVALGQLDSTNCLDLNRFVFLITWGRGHVNVFKLLFFFFFILGMWRCLGEKLAEEDVILMYVCEYFYFWSDKNGFVFPFSTSCYSLVRFQIYYLLKQKHQQNFDSMITLVFSCFSRNPWRVSSWWRNKPVINWDVHYEPDSGPDSLVAGCTDGPAKFTGRVKCHFIAWLLEALPPILPPTPPHSHSMATQRTLCRWLTGHYEDRKHFFFLFSEATHTADFFILDVTVEWEL